MKRIRMGARAAVMTGLVSLVLGCTEDRFILSTSSEAGVRDSAGIRIVENAMPLLETPWRLAPTPAVAIDGNGPPDETPLDPTSVFQMRNGTIVVGDGDQSGWDAILMYDPSGNFVRKVGGSGEGPGEFGQLWFAAPYRGDSLYAVDMRGWTASVFDSAGTFARKISGPSYRDPIPEGSFGFVPGFAQSSYEDGTFLASPFGFLDVPESPGVAWYVHDMLRVLPDGTAWDTLGRHRIREEYWDGAGQGGYAFGAHAFEVAVGSRTVLGDGRAFEYRLVNRDWQVEQIVRKTVTPEPVQEADLQALLDWALAVFSQSPEFGEEQLRRFEARFWDEPHAETKPAFSNLLVDDDGRVWVENFWWIYPGEVPLSPVPAVWSVFDVDGTWLTDVETPARFVVESVSGDRVFGFRVDDFDLYHVEVYELIK